MRKKIILILISFLLITINLFANDVQIELQIPNNEDTINYGTPIIFKWVSGDYDNYIIQIDYSYEISVPLKEIKIDTNEYSFNSAELDMGYHYYWKVIGKKDGKITGTSNIRTFYLE